MGTRNSSNEELTRIGVRTCIGHREHIRMSMVDLKGFIRERDPIDGHATCSVVVSDVSSLDHELGDDSMHDGGLVGEEMGGGVGGGVGVAYTELAEIVAGVGGDVIEEGEDHTAGRGVVYAYVHEYLLGARWRGVVEQTPEELHAIYMFI
jgi:hypothetical protein